MSHNHNRSSNFTPASLCSRFCRSWCKDQTTRNQRGSHSSNLQSGSGCWPRAEGKHYLVVHWPLRKMANLSDRPTKWHILYPIFITSIKLPKNTLNPCQCRKKTTRSLFIIIIRINQLQKHAHVFLVSICFHQFQLGSNMPKLTALPSCNTLVDITKVYHSIVISRPEGQTQASQSSDLGLSIRNGCLLLASWCSLYHEFVGRFYTSRVWCRISSTALWLVKKWNWMGSFTVPFEVYVYSSLWSPDPWPGKHAGGRRCQLVSFKTGVV